jgi:MFS family permease
VVRWNLLLGALQFGLFMMFWTALTLLLSEAPFSYAPLTIGLLGLFGLAGALAAQHTGRFHDRGWSMTATGAGWAIALVAMLLAALGEHSLPMITVAILLLHLAIFPMNVLISARLFTVVAGGRSRVNTAMIAVNFIAGAIGSALVSRLWPVGGWHAVTTAGIGVCVAGLALWIIGRHGALGEGTTKESAPGQKPPPRSSGSRTNHRGSAHHQTPDPASTTDQNTQRRQHHEVHPERRQDRHRPRRLVHRHRQASRPNQSPRDDPARGPRRTDCYTQNL